MYKIIIDFNNISFIKTLISRILMKLKKSFIFYGIVFLILVIIFTFIKPLYIRGPSMKPTINDKDCFIVNCLSKYTKDYNRGDIVAFIADKEILNDYAKVNLKFFEMSRNLLNLPPIYIKRIIALEGDTFEITANNEVLINDEVITEDYILEKPNYSLDKLTVPKGHLIVLGDNRNNSYDSSDFGSIPIKNIVGVVELKFFPLNDFKKIN